MPNKFPPGKASLPTIAQTVAQSTKATRERVKYLPRKPGMCHDWTTAKQGGARVPELRSTLRFCVPPTSGKFESSSAMVWEPLKDKVVRSSIIMARQQ